MTGLMVVVALLLAPAASAEPAAGLASSQADPRVIVHLGEGSTTTGCRIDVGRYTGYRICGYDWTEIRWSDGQVRVFVIGTNYAVWNIYLNAHGGSGGWGSLGGQARIGVYPVWVTTSVASLGIGVYGTDYQPWCKYLRAGIWDRSWHRC